MRRLGETYGREIDCINVILEKDTEGKWIVLMLTFSPLALKYFDSISKIKLEHYAGSECSSGETIENSAIGNTRRAVICG